MLRTHPERKQDEMATTVTPEQVTLNYKCDNDGAEWAQPATDVTEVGTLICPECEDDMSLVSVTVA